MNYELMLVILGAAFLGAALAPRFLSGRWLSLPMLYVATGMALPWLLPDMPRLDPVAHGPLVERLTEMAVIVSLMGAGLKLDRPIGFRSWASTWWLLAVTMPLSIIAVMIGGVWLAGLPLIAALLLGASIAPTDPVLASSVQVGPPRAGREAETRFALTSEAGLNDGLAFPFIYLALVIAADGATSEALLRWLAVDVIWKIACGVAVGIAVGRIAGWVMFRLMRKDGGGHGLVALALTILSYGLAELALGYGFLAVFAAAMSLRAVERDHDYHETLHDFAEQIESLLMAAILLALGVAVSQGLLAGLGVAGVGFALATIVVIRPLAGWLGMLGRRDLPLIERVSISVLGIRGIGTFFYLSYGINHGDFGAETERMLWAIAGAIVLISVLLHGIWAPQIMKRIEAAQSG